MALTSLFPDIGLKKHEFNSMLIFVKMILITKNEIGRGKKEGRQFLIQFATSKGFDFNNVQQWNGISRRELCDSKVSFFISLFLV